MNVRWVLLAGSALLPLGFSAQAQVRCTMPNGVTITQQLGDCPRGAVSAMRLDGTPVPLEAPAPPVASAPAVVAASAPALPAAEDDAGGLSFGGWLVVVALAVGLLAAVKGSAGVSGPVRYCAACGHEGKGRTRTRGSLLIEIVLWLCFLIPGLIYSIWRQGSKYKACVSCGSTTLVPLNSPVARAARRGADEPDNNAEARGAGADAWEGFFYDVAEQRSADKMVRMRYRDGDGKTSERVVHVRAFEPHGAAGLVIGHCHLRNATRTFRFDRMVRVVDEDTGEIIPDLQDLLNAEWAASPEPALDALYREHRDLLKMLLYTAKADGAMRAAEVRVIAQHCVQITGDERITPALVKELLAMVDAPSIVSFTRIFNRLRRERPADAARAAQACRDIISTQKQVHPAEQAVLDVLAKPLPNIAPRNVRAQADA